MPVATDPMVEKLVSERAETLTKIDGVKTYALDKSRDLSAEELDSIKTYSQRVRDIDAQLDVVTANVAMSDAIADRIALASPGTNATGHVYRSAGERWSAYVR